MTRKIFFVGFLLLVCNAISSQTTAIPDANFEQQLVSLGYDTNGLNGTILNTDAEAVTSLTLTGTNITNLTGLEAFVNLVTLNLGNNQFATVPLNTLTVLEELVFNQNVVLASLDLSNNLNLKKLDIRANGGANAAPITLIDLSNNLQLEYIHIYNFKLLQNVIFPNTATVKYVYLLMFANINVDFSGYDNLETLTLSTNFSNTLTINVVLPSNQFTLQSASFQGGNIINANFSNCLALEFLSMQSTNTATVQLPVTTTLKQIRISSHNIDFIDFSNASALEVLDIINKMGSVPLVIDISQNPLLIDLDARNNNMTVIDVTQNTLLEKIDVSNNNLTALDVTQNTLLENLNASINQLPSLNLLQNTVLTDLILNNNLLPNLDVTQNIVLERVNISNNLFSTTGLDLTQNTVLNYLKASFNQIESLDITQNAKLTSLILDHNLFTGTSILDQFYTIRQNDGGINYGILNVSFNTLFGIIPNFTSLFHTGQNGTNNWTRRFEFYFDNNNFEFGHFENQHNDYVVATTTFSPPPSNIVVLSKYFYAPQAKVDTIDTINATTGSAITLTTVCAGAQNHYVWFKDGVVIPGAPDSPNYTIPIVSNCDQGVYYCEIRSDLVPFENTNPPGTSGKNLLLIRNDITLNVNAISQACEPLISPINGSVNVPIDALLTWQNTTGACGFYLSIGTTSDGTDILNNVDIGNVDFYDLPANFPPNTQIFVTLSPYYSSGVPLNCTEESFTTNNVATTIACTTLINPLNNATNVSVSSNVSWNAVSNATGYIISIGTTSGGTDIVNAFDNGNNTIYNPTNDFPENTQIFVTVTPYNSGGNATGCASESFSTEVLIPTCTTLINPLNNATNVSISSTVSWNAVSNATGYFISIGTTSGGTQFVNNFDNGNSTTFNPITDFAQNTQYFVTITPYNSAGNAVGCTSQSFTTELLVPLCSSGIYPPNNATNIPVDEDVSWQIVSNATGYFISIGTSSGGTDFLNNFDNGSNSIYNSPVNFASNTTYYVTITPYNSAGNAVGCTSTQFTTETVVTFPSCTTLVSPLNGNTNVAINAAISWNAVSNATGYFISYGTNNAANNIENMVDVGNTLTYNPPIDFPDETIIYVVIIPYNAAGNAIGCNLEYFETEVVIPTCTNLTSPLDNATNVSVSSDISWNSVSNATGYFISYGTNAAGNNFANMVDVGNVLTYNPTTDFPDETIIYVTITPYNAAGPAIGCAIESFETEAMIPFCTSLTSPLHNATNVSISSNITWNAVSNAIGYFISIGTTSGGTDIVNAFDNGNNTTYNPTTDFPENTQIFVSVTPYNSVGNATGCALESFITENSVLVIPLFFTPNGDGYHDVWKIEDPKDEVKSISIFDRYGKLVKQFSSKSGWDGTFNNQQLVATDYWYLIERKSGELLKGHFSLKR